MSFGRGISKTIHSIFMIHSLQDTLKIIEYKNKT